MQDSYNTIRRKLSGLRRNIRWMFVAHGMAWVLLSIALLLLWHYLTDVFLHLSLPLRVGALGMMGVVLLAVIVRKVIYPLTRKISEEELALLVENEYPLLNDRLITALQFMRDRERYRGVASPTMVDEVIREGFDVANRLRFREVVQSGQLLLMTGIAIVVGLGLGTVLMSNQSTAQRWARRLLLANVEYERKVKLDIQFPTDLERFPSNDVIELNHTFDMDEREVRVARGAGLRVIALPKSGDPESATIRFVSKNGDSFEERMNIEYNDDKDKKSVAYFHYNIPALLNDQDIYIEAGDAEDGPFNVIATPAPTLAKDTRITYSYPAYMEREDTVQIGSRNIEAPEGTRVQIDFRTDRNQPLAEDGAMVTFYLAGADPQKVIAQALNDERTAFRIEYKVDVSTTEYEFTMLGEDGLRNTERLRYSIKAELDQAPEASFTFHGRGLDDESRVPVTLGGKIPLRYHLTDSYGIKRRELLFRIEDPNMSARESKNVEWISYAPFSSVYEQRDSAASVVTQGIASMTETIQRAEEDLSKGESINAAEFVQRLKTAATTVSGKLERLRAIARTQLRPVDPKLRRALQDAYESWQQFNSAAATANNETLSQSREDVASGLRTLESLGTAALDASRLYLHMTRTDVHDEFLLDISDLVSETTFKSEDKLYEAMTINGSQPLVIDVKILAEDRNFKQESGRGGIGESSLATFELMTKSALEGRISRYIRNTLKEDLNRIVQKLSSLHGDMQSFVELARTLNFGSDSEGRASRDIMSRAQTREAELPDATIKLADRFSNVAQAYVFNDLEYEDPEKPQENTIQIVRVVLMLLSAEVSSGDTISNSLTIARTHESSQQRMAAVDALLDELGLLDGLTGVRDSFDRLQFARVLQSSAYTAPSSLQRLDLLYKSLMRVDASAESRRRDLEAILYAQKQSLAGFSIVTQRVGRWESFDAIREEMERLISEHDRVIREIQEAFQ